MASSSSEQQNSENLDGSSSGSGGVGGFGGFGEEQQPNGYGDAEMEQENEEEENGQADQMSNVNEEELPIAPQSLIQSNYMELKKKKKDDEDQQLANGLSKIKLSEELSMLNRRIE